MTFGLCFRIIIGILCIRCVLGTSDLLAVAILTLRRRGSLLICFCRAVLVFVAAIIARRGIYIIEFDTHAHGPCKCV